MTGQNHLVPADYVTGRIPPERRQAAEEHLSHCEECQAAVGAVQQMHKDQRFADTTRAILLFTAQIVQGGATILAPSLRRLTFESSPPSPEAKATSV